MEDATHKLTIPPPLREGDRAVIVSPASKIDPRFLDGAKQRLEAWGLDVRLAAHAASEHGTYAGTVAQRLADLQRAMDDEDVRLILCSRGGYGCVHLLEGLRFDGVRRAPKWLAGFSDITALHCLWQHEGLATLHAPMARHLTVEPPDDFCTVAMRDVLFGQTGNRADGGTYACAPHKLNRHGTGEGILRGGNLAVAYGLRGTPYDIPAEGTVLFIEDVGERPHAVERMVYNLRLGGVLQRLAGVVVGQFTGYEEDRSLGKELYAALADVLTCCTCPVCFGFPVGHTPMNVPLVCGSRVRLEVGRKGARLLPLTA